MLPRVSMHLSHAHVWQCSAGHSCLDRGIFRSQQSQADSIVCLTRKYKQTLARISNANIDWKKTLDEIELFHLFNCQFPHCTSNYTAAHLRPLQTQKTRIPIRVAQLWSFFLIFRFREKGVYCVVNIFGKRQMHVQTYEFGRRSFDKKNELITWKVVVVGHRVISHATNWILCALSNANQTEYDSGESKTVREWSIQRVVRW